MKHTIDDLKKVWLEAGYELNPYTKEEIDEAIKRFGTLPSLLIEYYEKIGEIEDDYQHSIHVIGPAHLYTQVDGEENPRTLLMFASEMQGVCDYGIDEKDMIQKNPLVYCGGDPYYDIAKFTEYFYIPGTNYDIEADPYDDNRSLMHSLWSIAYCEIQAEWEFEDDNIYGYTKEQQQKYRERKEWLENAYQQKRTLEKLLTSVEIEAELTDFSLVRDLEFSCAGERAFGEKAKSGPCGKFELLMKAQNVELLRISDTIIEDSAVIGELHRLKDLILINCEIKDLSFLKSLTNLESLILRQIPIKQISDLDTLINLKELYLIDLGLSDIKNLKNIKNLRKLHLDDNQIVDLSALENMSKLKEFQAENNQIEKIDALKRAANLSFIRLKNNKIKDISAFEQMKGITNIDLSNNQISDITPLHQCVDMYYLNMNYNPVSDITAISNMKEIYLLELNNTKIKEIESLEDCIELRRLCMNHTAVSDLSPVIKMDNLETLGIVNTNITDISAVKGKIFSSRLDLRGVYLSSLQDIEEGSRVCYPWEDERGYTTRWQGYEDFLKNEFWKEYANTTNQKFVPESCFDDLKELAYVCYDHVTLDSSADLERMESYKNLVYLKFVDVTIKIKDFNLPGQMKGLELNNTTLSDLDFLRNLKQLKCLQIEKCNVDNFSFLKELPNLEAVYIEQDSIEDLSFIKAVMESKEFKRFKVISDAIPDDQKEDFVKGVAHDINIENGEIVLTPVQ